MPLEPGPTMPEGQAPAMPLTRTRAAAEVLLCSGYPTQLLIVTAMAAFGFSPGDKSALSPAFVFTLSALDTLVLLGLVWMFLYLSDESPREVFLGRRPAAPEAVAGVLTLPLLFVVVIAVQVAIRAVAPFLHNVEVSPFLPLLSSPWLLAGFVALVLVAGGIREELQRAFLLHRFEQRLGGGPLGLAVTSVAFGLGHTVQGWDAAVITGLLGAFWGAMYLARRSVAGTVASHALFNVVQIAVGYVTLAPASA